MPQLRTIQVARGIAANLVVFSHLFLVETKYTAAGVLPAFTLYGIAGVDLFFVLSGFIMVAVAGRDIGPIEFLWRRATRIYPTYWLSFSSGARRRDCSTRYCELVDPSSDLAVAIILAYS